MSRFFAALVAALLAFLDLCRCKPTTAAASRSLSLTAPF